MKTVKFFLSFVFFVVGVVLAAWFFMPWKQVGESALLFAARWTSSRIAYASVGGVPGGFSVQGLEVHGLLGMVDISFRTLTVTPDIASSLLNMVPTCRFAFTGGALGDIAVTPRKKIPGIFLGSGRVAASFTEEEVLLEDLRSNGDLTLNGTLLFALSDGPFIRQADVMLAVNFAPFEKELPSLQMAFGLPLRQEASGRWSLRQARGEVK
ncbi:MAG: hypothetical protein LBD04_04565 [Synergistaceae bacterium]|jgi:hypothetical protein|nr:hypothetical protein [Synergistaceae bacterium]